MKPVDALEEERFWAQAEAAASWRRSLPEAERAEIEAQEAALDRALDSLD